MITGGHCESSVDECGCFECTYVRLVVAVECDLDVLLTIFLSFAKNMICLFRFIFFFLV